MLFLTTSYTYNFWLLSTTIIVPLHKIDYMIYLESFMLPPENRQVYPYKQMYEKGLEMIDFAPITIFYGSNGSGKSTLLNIIASKVGVNNKTLGNTSEYFDGFVRKCTDVSMQIPTDSMFIRSEDIMELIADRRKKNASIDRTVKGWFTKGADKSTKGTLEEEIHCRRNRYGVLWHWNHSGH